MHQLDFKLMMKIWLELRGLSLELVTTWTDSSNLTFISTFLTIKLLSSWLIFRLNGLWTLLRASTTTCLLFKLTTLTQPRCTLMPWRISLSLTLWSLTMLLIQSDTDQAITLNIRDKPIIFQSYWRELTQTTLWTSTISLWDSLDLPMCHPITVVMQD